MTMSSSTFTPLGAAENSSTIAASATVAASEEKQQHMTQDDGTMEPSSSTVVDIAPDLKNPTRRPRASFWSSFVNAATHSYSRCPLARRMGSHAHYAATKVEENLAEWFGLNQSKYQWAVDEFMDRQLSGESQGTPGTLKSVDEKKMQPIGQQVMQRDTNQLADIQRSPSL